MSSSIDIHPNALKVVPNNFNGYMFRFKHAQRYRPCRDGDGYAFKSETGMCNVESHFLSVRSRPVHIRVLRHTFALAYETCSRKVGDLTQCSSNLLIAVDVVFCATSATKFARDFSAPLAETLEKPENRRGSEIETHIGL